MPGSVLWGPADPLMNTGPGDWAVSLDYDSISLRATGGAAADGADTAAADRAVVDAAAADRAADGAAADGFASGAATECRGVGCHHDECRD